MKGFADYIIAGWDEIQKEIERDVFEVEAPLGGEMFKEWLVQEGLAERTASSYLSNIKRLDKDLFPEIMDEDFFYLLKEYLAKAPDKAIELMERVQSAIRQEQKKGNPVMPTRAFNDCHSAFVKYMEFINLLIDAGIRKTVDASQDDEAEEVPLFEDGHVSFDYDTLLPNFRLRLATQDRLTGGDGKVFYPIRLLLKIFAVNDEDWQFIDDWLNRSLKYIDVLTDEGKFKFKDIETLDIDTQSGEAFVIVGDGYSATLLTRTAEGEIVPMNVKKLQEISIDHSPAIHNILVNKADKLHGLAKLTAIIKDYIKANKIEQPERSASVISTEIFKQKEDELVTLIPELKQDLVFIQNSINLELMDRKENTRKHAK